MNVIAHPAPPAFDKNSLLRMTFRCLAVSLVLLLSLLMPLSSMAESPEDTFLARYQQFADVRSFMRGGDATAIWLEDGSSFVYTDDSVDPPLHYQVDPVRNSREPIDAEAFAAFVAKQDKTPPRPAGQSNEVSSPDGRYAIGAQDFNLYLRTGGDGKTHELTEDGTEQFAWASRNSTVYIRPSMQWSPDSRRFLTVRSDISEVPRLPMVDWLADPRETVGWDYYTRTGEPLGRDHWFIIDANTQKLVPVEGTGEADQYYFPLAWREDSSEFLFIRSNRLMNRLEMMAADASTGQTRTLFVETSDTFIGGLDFFIRYTRRFTAVGPDRFIWLSERDGYDHLYLYDYDGKLIKQLTKGKMVVNHVQEVDLENRWIYLDAQSDPVRPYDNHLCRVNFDGEQFQQLSEGKGQHVPPHYMAMDNTHIQFSPSQQFFLDTWSSPASPPRTELRRANGELLRVLSEANIDELKATGWKAPEEFVAKAADGTTDLHGVLFFPAHFDPARRYPVVDLIYNTPFVFTTAHSFSQQNGGAAQALAQGDMIFVMVDGRGTTGRGKAFQDVVVNNWGRNEIPDHVTAIRQAAKDRPYMDIERVGIFGASWGGYMAIRGMLMAPEFFKAGVALVPVADLYTHPANVEWYIGTPQTNPEAYEFASSLRLADQLANPLLLIAGTNDGTARFRGTMKFVDALIAAQKPVDMLVIPGMGHGPFRPDHSEYFGNATLRYLVEHLQSTRTVYAQ